jgi:hypothetical protein
VVPEDSSLGWFLSLYILSVYCCYRSAAWVEEEQQWLPAGKDL